MIFYYVSSYWLANFGSVKIGARLFFLQYNINLMSHFTLAISTCCFSIFLDNLIISCPYFSWIYLKILNRAYNFKINRMMRIFIFQINTTDLFNLCNASEILNFNETIFITFSLSRHLLFLLLVGLSAKYCRYF